MSALKTRQENDILFVYFTDVKLLDEARIVALKDELLLLLESDATKIVINFQGVQFLSSSFINKALYPFKNKVQSTDVQYYLCSICLNAWEVFKVTRNTTTFPIASNEEAAIRALNK